MVEVTRREGWNEWEHSHQLDSINKLEWWTGKRRAMWEGIGMKTQYKSQYEKWRTLWKRGEPSLTEEIREDMTRWIAVWRRAWPSTKWQNDHHQRPRRGLTTLKQRRRCSSAVGKAARVIHAPRNMKDKCGAWDPRAVPLVARLRGTARRRRLPLPSPAVSVTVHKNLVGHKSEKPLLDAGNRDHKQRK